MLTEGERFAFETRRHHALASTGNAYDAAQCDEAIKTGDTLIVFAERVVAIAMAWPFAVTPRPASRLRTRRRYRPPSGICP